MNMDMIPQSNYVRLCGTPAEPPQYSHSSRGQAFYRFPLTVERLSGACDTLNILVRPWQLEALTAPERLLVEGQLRSFNNRSGQGARLVITVLARDVSPTQEADSNLVRLCGTLCKAPNLRCTPMGRDICDLMLAVNRRCGRSDYLPCICWGLSAREAAHWQVGDQVRLSGRLQSRRYSKLTEAGPVEKTAFEVSAGEVVRERPRGCEEDANDLYSD